MSDNTVTQNPSIILHEDRIAIPSIVGDDPRSLGSANIGNALDEFTGGVVSPPVRPREAMRMALSSGGVMSVCHAVAEGTSGLGFELKPRDPTKIEMKDRKSWSPAVSEQHDRAQVLIQAGYRGDGKLTLRDAIHDYELDRVILGWGGMVVVRSTMADDRGIGEPIALGRFEACGAEFTKPDRTLTNVPVPVALSDGRVLWIAVPRAFRRIRYVGSAGRSTWFKEYGDWRSMDARTGKYSTGARFYPSTDPMRPGKCTPGVLPKGSVPASEVAHFATGFPGVAPYGVSGWHAEMSTVASASEHIKLVLDYLRSGLHCVTIAAADRPFEDAQARAAVSQIDELGRGRQGLGKLITIALTPESSDKPKPGAPFGNPMSADRGRLVLHQITTTLPQQLLDETLSDALSARIAQAERIPGLLIGRSDAYTFATASAAWTTANRLRFRPHHQEHDAFLNSLLIEKGITDWMITTVSPDWEVDEPLAGVASVAGQNGGISANRAMALLSHVMDIEIKKIDTWWGDIPMPIVQAILTSADPQATLDALAIPGAPKIPQGESSITAPITETLSALNKKLDELSERLGTT